jgi:glycosyltransferase involved in cell wall biosynthesis
VATPARTVCDDNSRALFNHGLLRFHAMGTRNGIQGVPPELTRLNPKIGTVAYGFAKVFSTFLAESLRFRLHPWFDSWVRKQLEPGNHVISSYGYANESFRWSRDHGGKTFVDGGNSHPENFWKILTEEHARWKCPVPPVAHHHHERSVAMMEFTDYVLSPSSFVSKSFLSHGFKPSQILRNVYPIDLGCFKPPSTPRPKDRPLTIIAPGSLSLRKGTPYLLEGFRMVLKTIPTARLVLTQSVFGNVEEIFRSNADLPIDWHPPLKHPQLAEKMRGADILVLPSLEDGFARTVTEGLGCGLPIITTPNTGASDVIVPGKNGEIVPIRDPRAICEAVLKWADKILSGEVREPITFDSEKLSFANFEKEFISQLTSIGLA